MTTTVEQAPQIGALGVEGKDSGQTKKWIKLVV